MEGLNLLYRLIGATFFLSMHRFKSAEMLKLFDAVKETTKRFIWELNQLSKNSTCLDSYMLKRCILLKKKHYVYGAYLATISSYPILYWIEAPKKILASIFAKTSAITSIKILDNLNDKLYCNDRAAVSLPKYLEAFTEDHFYLNEEEGLMYKAENSAYKMARWTFNILKRNVDTSSLMFKMYVDDFARLVKGQTDSLKQKMDGQDSSELNIYRYLKDINEKGVGCIWSDIDFCFYEKALGGFDNDEKKSVDQIRMVMDYVFKACNLYDDVADLREDLLSGHINSVALLAVDQGYCSMKELLLGEESVRKLRRSQALEDSIYLGDLIFLKAIKYLYKAKCNNKIDIDALIFGIRILRLFSMRKWILRDKDKLSFKTALKSFQEFDSYSIPERIRRYEKYI